VAVSGICDNTYGPMFPGENINYGNLMGTESRGLTSKYCWWYL
jgi:hypothetical protein